MPAFLVAVRKLGAPFAVAQLVLVLALATSCGATSTNKRQEAPEVSRRAAPRRSRRERRARRGSSSWRVTASSPSWTSALAPPSALSPSAQARRSSVPHRPPGEQARPLRGGHLRPRGQSSFFIPSSKHGDLLAWCDASYETLHVTDVLTGEARAIAPPEGFVAFDCGSGAFSPDSTLLAVPVTGGDEVSRQSARSPEASPGRSRDRRPSLRTSTSPGRPPASPYSSAGASGTSAGPSSTESATSGRFPSRSRPETSMGWRPAELRRRLRQAGQGRDRSRARAASHTRRGSRARFDPTKTGRHA
jgi:hypothetical protein